MKIEIDENGYTADGWRLVPVEMTDAQFMVVCDLDALSPNSDYAAAIKAAPVYVPPMPKTRYDWSNIPAGYDWAATDRCGNQYAYRQEPEFDSDRWLRPNRYCRMFFLRTIPECHDWRESLERRPCSQN